MTRRPWLALAMLLLMPLAAAARGYTPQGRCGDYARLDIRSPAGTCVALLADENEGLRAPRRVLEIAPGRYWVVDMGSWEPRKGRLLEMTLPADGPAPRRARFTVIAEQLDRPLGLALGPDGKIYVGEAGSIWRAPIPAPGGSLQREMLIDNLPRDGRHPLKELAFGPGGRMYVNMGSDSDDCRDGAKAYPLPCPDGTGPMPRAAVYEGSFGGDGFKLQGFKPFATGLRNSAALTVLADGPAKGTVLQGENSIDYDPADQPPEELNHLQAGRDYGWPYCVGRRQPARGYEARFDCSRTEAPWMLWPAHVAPLQMQVGPAGSRFAGQLLVAWRGHRPAGHRVVGYKLDAKGMPSGRPIDWLAGWTPQPGVRPLGRPTGLTVDRQGRMLVVEDFNRTVLMLISDGSASASASPKK